jgi:hypothetical protein
VTSTVLIEPPYPAYVGDKYFVSAEDNEFELANIFTNKTPTSFDYFPGFLFDSAAALLLQRV